MPYKLIVGKQPWLSLAAEDWKRSDPDLQLHEIEVSLEKNYQFSPLELPNPVNKNHTAFVAWGPDFLNFQRLELMTMLKMCGFKMPPLISANAIVYQSAQINENAWIQPFAFIGPNSTVGVNSVIGMYTTLYYSCAIGKNTWIGSNVQMGSSVEVGSNTLLGSGVRVSDNSKIGKNSRIEDERVITGDWLEGQFSLKISNLEGRIFDYSKAQSK